MFFWGGIWRFVVVVFSQLKLRRNWMKDTGPPRQLGQQVMLPASMMVQRCACWCLQPRRFGKKKTQKPGGLNTSMAISAGVGPVGRFLPGTGGLQLKDWDGSFIPKIGEIFLQFDTAETGTGILQMNPPKRWLQIWVQDIQWVFC